MADIVLIQPPNKVLSQPTMYFGLGLLYVAASLEETGHNVKIVDFRDKSIDFSLIPEADYYGITATTGEIEDAKFISHGLKKWRKNAITIIGGPHATILPQDCVEDFDYVIVGEGEKAIVEVLEGKWIGKLAHSPPIENLDSIPFPARHLLPEEAVFSQTLYMGEKYGKGPKSTTIISSRGCPFRCSFCANVLPQKVRFRSPENFVNEIKFLQDRYDCHHFRFVDDNFTLNKQRVLQICDLLEPCDVHYRAQARSNLLDAEICQALKTSGCEEMGLGVETADDHVLKLNNKQETVSHHKKAIRLLKEAGIYAKAYFMVGLPGSTNKTIQKNMDFVKETQIDKYTVSIFMPYPGCEVANNPEKFGVTILDKDYSHYWNFPEFPAHQLEHLSQRAIYEQYKQFCSWLRSGAWRR